MLQYRCEYAKRSSFQIPRFGQPINVTVKQNIKSKDVRRDAENGTQGFPLKVGHDPPESLANQKPQNL